LKKIISVLKYRYGSDLKLFLMSHSFGGLVAAGYLTEGNNQQSVKGWINMAGAHNYHMNDSLTRAYLLSYGKEQIALNNHTSEWQEIVNTVEPLVADHTYKTSLSLNLCSSKAETLIDDIHKEDQGNISDLFTKSTYPFSTSQALSNSSATFISGLNKELMDKEFSSKLSTLTIPVLSMTGKYDFTVPKGLAEEVYAKVSSTDKELLILPHSGHILMGNEPERLYSTALAFIRRQL
jgi:pimeloyl-ACP methyl ester carboxylesterase